MQTPTFPIADLAASLGLEPEEVSPYGGFAAKLELSALDRLAGKPDGRLVSVTAMTPTKAGEGKTTTAISLVEGLARIGERSLLCIREPSLGPVFGIKGGGTGGGRAQLVPMEQINLHFTGDIHAVGAANNLLAAMIDSHIFHGNKLGLDPHAVGWRRCFNMNDRALRKVIVGLGASANGEQRETGFDITVASEVMAIVAVSRDLGDLRARLGAITVGATFDGEPVTAEQIGAAGSMAVLLKDALKPNLVQTDGGQSGARPLRAVREHRPRQQLARRRPARAEAGRLRRHRERLRRRDGIREVRRHRLPHSAGLRRAPSCSSRPFRRSSTTAAIPMGACRRSSAGSRTCEPTFGSSRRSGSTA